MLLEGKINEVPMSLVFKFSSMFPIIASRKWMYSSDRNLARLYLTNRNVQFRSLRTLLQRIDGTDDDIEEYNYLD